MAYLFSIVLFLDNFPGCFFVTLFPVTTDLFLNNFQPVDTDLRFQLIKSRKIIKCVAYLQGMLVNRPSPFLPDIKTESQTLKLTL